MPRRALAAGLLASLLCGCSLLRPQQEGTDAAPGDAAASQPVVATHADGTPAAQDGRPAFALEVQAPREVRDYLLRHLELQRYRNLPDLQAAELSRLLGAAEANARELLNTLGYFTPTLTLDLRDTPAGAAPREITLRVEPGERTRVEAVAVDFAGEIASDARAAAQREAIRQGWSLRAGQPFTQDGWDGAKTGGLHALNAYRFPTGSVSQSRAAVDADTGQARLAVTYDSGPAYRFGPVEVRGNERYPPEVAARLSRLPVGADYDQTKLLEAQQRLAASGYFDSVFLTLAPDPADPLAAPVIAQVRDAPLQKVVAGVGFSTDSGPRLTVDHTHNQLPLIGWRSVSRLVLDAKTQSLGSEQSSLPGEDGWRWATSELVKRETSGDYELASGRLRAGRAKSTDHIDRNFYLQYDYARYQGSATPPSGAALSANYAWTGRYFDSNTAPTRGWGLAVEAGPGYTLLGERAPFLRGYARALGYVPLGAVLPQGGGEARRARLQLRGEVGAVATRETAQVPASLLFLTGGDTTVRGYGYRQIGARTVNGFLYAGRYLGVLSAEWQRPVVWKGQMTDFESAVFVDAGAVADHARDLDWKVGVGGGVRWKSPVGPLQADLAYGLATHRLRLHLRLGFTF